MRGTEGQNTSCIFVHVFICLFVASHPHFLELLLDYREHNPDQDKEIYEDEWKNESINEAINKSIFIHVSILDTGKHFE